MIAFLLLLATAVLFLLDGFAVIEVPWWVCALPLAPLLGAAIVAFVMATLWTFFGVKTALRLRVPRA